ncbi:hypothetical protein [Nocardioides lianchengensis]|uniref:Uncharacterized protein n=1 Tax=Nocardioides lianchengensis TaxID=1045774 RepID=A0A1G6TKL0_9ACTN|nr:hypothetical protein [Nocardioides lianchengensis]NYG11739.1 hypothetical protein [Nocardioides lianchengensis]SDD29046.1 hypothetical protein SAMN05421872_10794 [Nocardioides lianchengensis]
MTITLTPLRAALAVLVVGVVIVAGVLLWPEQDQDEQRDQSPRAAPYDDTLAAGSLTLCSADGQPVTEGSTKDRPFADVVRGETALPSELDPAGAVATLYAYQPREGVGTEEFSGTAITAAEVLPDPGQPAVRVTEDAWSVDDFVTAFPATYDGFVQLRLYLGTPGAGTLSTSPYDTADLRVDDGRWELVRGGSASCADAESLVP